MWEEQVNFDDKVKVRAKQKPEGYELEYEGAKVFIYGGERTALRCRERDFDERRIPFHEGQEREQFAAHLCKKSFNWTVYFYDWEIYKMRIKRSDEIEVGKIHTEG